MKETLDTFFVRQFCTFCFMIARILSGREGKLGWDQSRIQTVFLIFHITTYRYMDLYIAHDFQIRHVISMQHFNHFSKKYLILNIQFSDKWHIVQKGRTLPFPHHSVMTLVMMMSYVKQICIAVSLILRKIQQVEEE